MVLAIVYIAGGILLYFIQDKILFHPKSLPRDHSFVFGQPFEELNIPFEGENLSIIKFRPPAPRNGIVLFYHGNMRNVEHYKKYPSIFTRNGYEIWMIDYPGFGKTTGKRSESVIYRQAHLMYAMAAKQLSSDSILVYGKSIGTGVASFIASSRPHQKLILETPYYNIDALARHYLPMYPVMPMTRYAFPNNTYLKKINTPVTIFHGTGDEIIPYAQAQKLKKENPAIELVSIAKGRHNNLSDFPVFQAKLDSLLSN